MPRPASDAQKRYIVSMAVKLAQADPGDQHYGAGRIAQRQYAEQWVRGMTATWASTCIDALKDRLARLA